MHQVPRTVVSILYQALTHNGVDRKKGESSEPEKRHGQMFLFLRDAGIALLFVVLILISMFAYTGMWPPLVVVESNSMMHTTDNQSHIGTIDTGDLVLVKKVTKPSDVSTYADGLSTKHRTYGDYGDVIVYKKGGSDTVTPIIHRAMIFLEINPGGTSYRSQALRDAPESFYTLTVPTDSWDHLTGGIRFSNVGYNHLTVTIDVGAILGRFDLQGTQPTDVFVTKGDHNQDTDLVYWGPVQFNWIVGKARGEIPWFGLLKLWSTHSAGAPAPSNSVRDLWIALILIIVAPIGVDIALSMRERRPRRSKAKMDRDRLDDPVEKPVKEEKG